MNNAYKGMAIAGTAKVNAEWRISREKVVNHYSKIHTTSQPEFIELVGVEVEPNYIGIETPKIKLTYNMQP